MVRMIEVEGVLLPLAPKLMALGKGREGVIQ